uniref:Uncharacterized protein n=1 Tax=Klebsiella pneumoniae TaxID=573 RepID=A0A2P1BNG2_KLEPN|nr:hypothetical protein [Klebsiella pneumoniae]
MPRACALANWSAPSGNVRLDEHGDHWLHLVGKGGKPGGLAAARVYGAGPILGTASTASQPGTVESENALVGSLGKTVMPASPALTFGACCEDSLRKPLRPLRPIIRSPPKSCAVPRLIDASQSCQPCVGPGAQLTAVRDNLRHASIATTSMYLHGDELERAGRCGRLWRSSRQARSRLNFHHTE